MSDKEKKISIVLFVLGIVFTIIGSTLSYWNWQSSNEQKTNVTFTVSSGFSCGADGGGSITSQQKILAPTSCTNTNYAFQRTITTNVTNNRSGSVYMNLWLDVNTIGTGLSESENFRYALTEQANDCEHNILSEGTFNGVEDGGRVNLLIGTEYASSNSNTYYLYIWLDDAETDSATQNQTYNISLGGNCTDEEPPIYVYTANVFDQNYETLNNGTNQTIIHMNQSIPAGISQFMTPEAAMAAFKQTTGGTRDRISFLRQRIKNDVVIESYVGFVVTPTMAEANSGMEAGKYYIRTGINEGSLDSKPIYEANQAILQRAFGSDTEYCNYGSQNTNCNIQGLNVNVWSNGDAMSYDNDYWGSFGSSDGITVCGSVLWLD